MNYRNTLFSYSSEPLLQKSVEYLYSKVWEYANIAAGEKVLDVGCGSGGFASKFGYWNYVGIDLSLSNVEKAKQDSGLPFAVGNALQLPFPDKSFDRIICCEVLEHFVAAEQVRLLWELGRVLKDEGTIVISVPNAYYLWCYIPYGLFPIKRRSTFHKLVEGCRAGNYDEEHEKFSPHYRFTPSYLKNLIEYYTNLLVVKQTTTYWYNNRYIKSVPKSIQTLFHKNLRGGLLGSQVVCRCTKKA